MTTKEKFIQLSLIHSTKRETQTVLGLTSEGRVFKGLVGAWDVHENGGDGEGFPNRTTVTWTEINLPNFGEENE